MMDAVFYQKVWRYIRYYPIDILRLLRLFVFIALFYLIHWRSPNNAEFIELVYQHFLASPLSAAALTFYRDNLDKGRFSRLQIIFSFLMLPIGIEQKLFSRTGIEAHHQARLKLVQSDLPAAEYVIDLGGASSNYQAGDLMLMGYPHQPQQIDIIDLNPAVLVNQSNPQQITTQDGIKVNYIRRSMTDFSGFKDNTVDLVWSGQSIEHITELEAEAVIQEIFRVLKPGGSFCLDTPNRQLTKLLLRGTGFVHPEHKIEYYPQELAAKIQQQGFLIEKNWAVSPMPYSLSSQKFSKLELMDSVGLGDNPDEGFSFFLCCRKLEEL